MKKLIYCAAALAAMIFAGSCQQENLEPVAQENTVTYTVEIPDVQTKAFGDGTNVNELVYEVWKIQDGASEIDTEKDTRLYHKTMLNPNGNSWVVNLNLVQNQNYKILFWAQVAQNDNAEFYNTENLTAVTYADTFEPTANKEEYAAFYGIDLINDNTPRNKTVTLKRPFGQLNIGTRNTADPEEYTITMLQSQVVVKDVPTVFNVATSAVSEEETITFAFADVPKNEGKLTVAEVGYDYVAMNYIFANDNIAVTYTINTEIVPTAADATKTTAKIEKTIPNVPVKENYRTNIVGNLLTNYATYNVVIDAEFNTPDVDVKVWDGKTLTEPTIEGNTYKVATGAELAWIAAQDMNYYGKTIILTDNIWLGDQRWTGIGSKVTFEGTFDGNGKTIYGLNVAVDTNIGVGLFSKSKGLIKNLTVDGAVVIGHYSAGVIVGNGLCAKIDNCHVKNATVTITPLNEDDGNHAGGIVGYLSAEPTGYVINSSVENATITAYRDVAAIAGTATTEYTTPKIKSNNVKNVVVIADQTSKYSAEKNANADKFVGRKAAAAEIEDNTADNVQVIVKVNSGANLERQANAANDDTIIVIAEDAEGNVNIKQRENIDLVISGVEGAKFDGVITVNGDARANGEETLTFRGINFEATDAKTFISAPSKIDGKYNYSHYITVENCSFTSPTYNEGVASISLTGTYNPVIKNCSATNIHSLFQLQSCGTNATIENVTVTNCKNGLSLGNVANATVTGAHIDAVGYGIRLDGAKERTVAVTITDSEIDAYIPVNVRKMNDDACNVEIDFNGENTLNGDEYEIAFCKNEYENSVDPVAPMGTFKLQDAEQFRAYYGPVTSASALDAAINSDAGNVTLEVPINNVGLGFEVERDIVLDFNNQELNAGSTANSYWYAIEASGDYDVVIDNAYFTRAGIYAEEGANVVFNSGVINHKPERTSRYIFCARNGSTITVNNGTFTNDRAKNAYFWADNSTIYVKGGNFGGVASNNKVVLSNGGQLIITGGTFNFDPTAWVAEGYAATKSGSTWTVAAK